MALFVRKLSNILASKLFAVVLISLILTCLSIFPIANASAQTCGWNWDILSISDIKTNYQPGETINGNISFRLHNAANSGAIQQLLIGIIDSQNNAIDVNCIYNGVPKACPAWTTGTASFSLKAPVTPGNYKVIASVDLHNSCSDAINRFPSLCSSASPYCKDITTITISASPPENACGGTWDITDTHLAKTNYQVGETINVRISFKISNSTDCPRCTQQILIVLIDSEGYLADWACIFDDIPQVCPDSTTGKIDISLRNPNYPGTYRIIATNEKQRDCSDAFVLGDYYPKITEPQMYLTAIKVTASTPTKEPTSPTISTTPTTTPQPTPPGLFDDLSQKAEELLAQIKQKIGLIIQQIWHVIKSIVLPIAALAIIGILLWKFGRGKGKRPTRGKPPYIPKWTFEAPAMETPQEFDIWNEIRNFRQRKGCSQEKEYQEELFKHLKRKFPQAEEKVRIGETIIDIRIDKTAIEIKGPTRAADFNRLRGQIQHYTFNYNLVYVVLFDPKFGHAQFDSLKRGIQRDWPNDVGVVTKPG